MGPTTAAGSFSTAIALRRLGAVGHPDIPDHMTLNGMLLPIRRAFDQYANVRPAYLYPGVASPLAGLSAGRHRHGDRARKHVAAPPWAASSDHNQPELAIQMFKIHTPRHRTHCALRLRAGREAGQEEARHPHHQSPRASLQHDAADRTFRKWCEFTGMEAESLLVDAAAMASCGVRKPSTVVVGSNLFSDILERFRGDRRQQGPLAQPQPRPAAPLPFDVRAGCTGPRRIWQGHCQPAGHDHERRHAAGPFGDG